MNKENLFVAVKSEVFALSVVNMMGEENEMEQGEVKVSVGVDGDVRISDNFGASETFLVALRCWSDGCSAQVAEDWLRNWPQEEMEESEKKVSGSLVVKAEELPRFPLRISEDLIVDEADGGYTFADRLGIEYDFDETVKIIEEMVGYFGK